MSAGERRAAFRELHRSGCFVIPNPWDIGSARYLSQLGFKALATTSSGFAFSQGLPDGQAGVPLEIALAHFEEIAAGVDIPVNADFQSAYAIEPDEVAENVRRCVDTGVAGLSVEDATGDPDKPLFELTLAVERIRAAKAAAGDTVLTARAECYLYGHPEPLKESIRRLTAYAEAGADVLYAPGPVSAEEIRAIGGAVSPKPVNILMSKNAGLRVSDLAELGVRRISVGSALARAAWTGFMRAARAIARDGSFAGFDGAVTGKELNEEFRARGNM